MSYMKKVSKASMAIELEQIPNIGKAVVKDLHMIGITKPEQLKGKDGMKLYDKLNKISGLRHDPCMADTLLAAVDFMNGGSAKPWWAFTTHRKKIFGNR
jgi:hypothetical protein